MDKKQLRREIRDRLSRLSAPERAARSAAVTARLVATGWWREAAVVLAFLPMPGELETWELVRAAREQGKTVAVPRIDGEELVFHRLDRPDAPLVSGVFGIPEPAPSLPVFRPEEARLAPVLVVTPGLAFDGRFNRLGRGKGFYDRWLQRLRAAAAGPSGTQRRRGARSGSASASSWWRRSRWTGTTSRWTAWSPTGRCGSPPLPIFSRFLPK